MATTGAPDSPPIHQDFGPSLPELVRRRFGVRERVTAIAVAALVVLVGAIALVGTYASRDRQLVHRGNPTFNLQYARGRVHRVPPHPGELARLEAHRGTLSARLVVKPIRLPPYRGFVSLGLLPVYATGFAERLRREYDGFQLRDEGKGRINDAPSYSIGFRAGPAGRYTWGRDAIVIPRDDNVRDGVVLSFSWTKAGDPTKRDKKVIDAMNNAFYSFAFGTERA